MQILIFATTAAKTGSLPEWKRLLANGERCKALGLSASSIVKMIYDKGRSG